MYDSHQLAQLSQFARVHAGSTVMDVWPGSGDWTRLFSEIVARTGLVYSFVPAELAHFKSDPVGQMRALAREGASAAGFNRAVYERLKPGRFYVIVDHVAATATGASHAESLHRIDPALVREEVETAGFVLDAASTVLANKDDPHSTGVFDPSIKGETDRFAYRFVKR